MKTQIIEIKTGSTPINQIVEAVQGDSGRVLRCIISDMSIPAGSTARFYAVKPSGAEIYNDCAIDGQAVVLNMTTQMLAEVGTLNGQIEVTNSGKTVTSFSFCVNVIKNIKSNSAIESSNEFTALDNALRKAEEVADPLINFEEAAEREMLTTRERLSVLVGKISKWIKDLKKAAFYDVANNTTTATAGTSVLDAYQGKLLKEQLDELNTNKVKYSIVSFTMESSEWKEFKLSDFNLSGSKIICANLIRGTSTGTNYAYTTATEPGSSDNCVVHFSGAITGGKILLVYI